MSHDYVELIKKWAEKDALTVTNGEHTRGRQAEIRKRMIKSNCNLSHSEQKSFYLLYCNYLVGYIIKIDDGKSHGTLPTFV